jgi:hypothetical protein
VLAAPEIQRTLSQTCVVQADLEVPYGQYYPAPPDAPMPRQTAIKSAMRRQRTGSGEIGRSWAIR